MIIEKKTKKTQKTLVSAHGSVVPATDVPDVFRRLGDLLLDIEKAHGSLSYGKRKE